MYVSGDRGVDDRDGEQLEVDEVPDHVCIKDL